MKKLYALCIMISIPLSTFCATTQEMLPEDMFIKALAQNDINTMLQLLKTGAPKKWVNSKVIIDGQTTTPLEQTIKRCKVLQADDAQKELAAALQMSVLHEIQQYDPRSRSDIREDLKGLQNTRMNGTVGRKSKMSVKRHAHPAHVSSFIEAMTSKTGDL